MSKITVLGANGMLGNMAVKVLKQHGHKVNGVGRDMFDARATNSEVLGVKLHRVADFETEYVINCIGAIKPMFTPGNMLDAIYTNAVFPHQLAYVCEARKIRLIHITTDCVFSGQGNGLYDENSKHDALDEYGKSKSLGEPTNCLVLRTSIIGPEFGGRKRSLLEWVLSQSGKTVNGFTNHFWNGLTTLELSRQIELIITNNLFANGTYHLFGSDISKDFLVAEIAHAYGIPLTIKPIAVPEACDRRLRTIKDIQSKVEKFKGCPVDITTMLKELAQYK